MRQLINGNLKTIVITVLTVIITNAVTNIFQFFYTSAEIKTKITTLQDEVRNLSNKMDQHIHDEYNRSDAERDFKIRDERIDKIEKKVERYHGAKF